ncbi:hypothetical protein EB118_12805 [bacterium]|nr:hypothetical protein [bacterium]NDD82954.1 hypothetical protein [bacterium]NDG30940.1 hypothetical protein [bacterium]
MKFYTYLVKLDKKFYNTDSTEFYITADSMTEAALLADQVIQEKYHNSGISSPAIISITREGRNMYPQNVVV